MAVRYTVRSTEHGYGVWDAAVHGWRSQQDLPHAEAEGLATKMTDRDHGRQNHATERSSVDTRVVDPPRAVEIFADGAWWPGELDRWTRHREGWYGRATRFATRQSDWYPAGRLRPS